MFATLGRFIINLKEVNFLSIENIYEESQSINVKIEFKNGTTKDVHATNESFEKFKEALAATSKPK